MIHGFDDTNKEKVPIITLTKSTRLEPNTVALTSWNYSELEGAGIDSDNLSKYTVLDLLHSDEAADEKMWESGKTKNFGTALYPHVRINARDKTISISDNGENLEVPVTITYKLRLMKVES